MHDIVTGAFSYTGSYIARALLDRDRDVVTLTNHPKEHPRIRCRPFAFDDPAVFEGCDTLYNTYWIRLERGNVTFDGAVANLRAMLANAKKAGVRRIVQISVTNADASSPLPYFRGKGQVEQAILESGLAWSILRPALVFGVEDILLNNIAWCLRKFPVFALPGLGRYRVQPIFAGDLAQLAVDAKDGERIDAIGPETFTFAEIVKLMRDAMGTFCLVVPSPAWYALFCARFMGWLLGDEMLIREEVEGLRTERLMTSSPPAAPTKFSEFVKQHGAVLGRKYVSELVRHYDGAK